MLLAPQKQEAKAMGSRTSTKNATRRDKSCGCFPREQGCDLLVRAVLYSVHYCTGLLKASASGPSLTL